MGQKRCSICGKEMLGYGHNAQPINDGRCCDACDDLYVCPMRIVSKDNNKPWMDIIMNAAKSARVQ